ncbi:serine hydrolase domain-containing protein [Glycomyces harbinensis]|uniref:CubicO group peptidase, beta-lactamase class C family n=1 Tax=Glycomyces harbinensis TaxID=58114 RepID=A0A1G6RH01_9ACTN|nr:serine hydrolase domain-containing protein [Glycomyces harbinensis]SDD03930.1 CubicO group peptidase, beta-lactamase class C family [Glycomyces harbinensis]
MNTPTATALAAALAALTPLASFTPPTGPLPQAPEDETHQRIERYLHDRFEETGVPGASYAIIDLEGDTYASAWGETGGAGPVDLGTPFLWGSVAKPVTATAAMTLVEDGLLDLDEPVAAYLPDFALADEDRSDRITVRHLLEQSSGIPEGTGITDDFGHRDDPYGEAVADLADVEPLADPGEDFAYASANYVVLGAVIEAVAGVPYADYLRTAVLDPLGMDTVVATGDEARQVPRGHSVVFGLPRPIKTRFDQTGPSYGYLGGTITDLQRFAEAMLDEERLAGVVTPESVALMQTGAVEVNDTVDYGLGWRVDERNADLGTSTVWHTGGAPGFTAGVILLPELDRAVVVAQNRYGYFQDAELVGTMLGAARMLAGGEPAETASDPLYPVLLVGLSLLIAASAFLVVRTFIRMGKARKASPAALIVGAGCWTVAGLAVAYVSFVVVPGLAPSRAAFTGMAPDVAGLTTALGVAALIVAAVRIWNAVVRIRPSRTRRRSRPSRA